MYEEAMRKGTENLFNLFIYPEIKRRKELGLIDDSFDLIAAQWIQYPDGRTNEIRLNSEVKALIKIIKKDGITKKKVILFMLMKLKMLN